MSYRIEAEQAGRRKHYRAVCVCGWESFWRGKERFATQAGERHAELFCEGGPVRPVHLGVFVHDSPEWHAARATRLGGSEVSALFGLSPWESEFSLYHRKVGTALTERVNDEMRAGTLLEPVIVGKFAAEHPDMLVQPRAGTWVHGERSWQLANPDALVSYRDEAGVTQGGILETKFALQTYGWGEAGTDDIPPYYATQVQWYLDVMGLAVCWLMVFIGGSAEWRTYVIRADVERQAELREAGAEFMDRVARRVAPPIDGHDATYEVVKEMHPDIEPSTVELSGEQARAFCEAKHAEAAAKVEAKRQTSLLAEVMGSAQRAKYAGRSIARRQAKGGGTPYVVADRGLPFGEILKETA